MTVCVCIRPGHWRVGHFLASFFVVCAGQERMSLSLYLLYFGVVLLLYLASLCVYM